MNKGFVICRIYFQNWADNLYCFIQFGKLEKGHF